MPSESRSQAAKNQTDYLQRGGNTYGSSARVAGQERATASPKLLD